MRTYQLLRRGLAPLLGLQRAVDLSFAVKGLKKKDYFAQPRTLFETKVVVDRFRLELRLTVDAARAAGVPIVLCTMASNVEVFPKRSVPSPGMPPRARAAAAALAEAAACDRDRGDLASAEWRLRRVLAVTPGYARLRWRLGEVLKQEGRYDDAYRQLVLAREMESTPSRALGAINRIIRETSRLDGVGLADIERAVLRSRSGGRWGTGLFLDHRHPTVAGHALFARVIADALVPASKAPGERPVPIGRLEPTGRRSRPFGRNGPRLPGGRRGSPQ